MGDGDPHGKHGNQGFEDNEEEGRMARERPEYAHCSHVDSRMVFPLNE